ncbi:MAG: hypothetical protein ACOY3H_04185 [Bacillota bacterium]
MVTINGTAYFDLVNAHGDMLGLVDSSGSLVVKVYHADNAVQRKVDVSRGKEIPYCFERLVEILIERVGGGA